MIAETRICEGMLYFAYPKFGLSRYLVTANADGSLPINAKEGEAVTTACVAQANFANQLLAALVAAQRDLPLSSEALPLVNKAIADSMELHHP